MIASTWDGCSFVRSYHIHRIDTSIYQKREASQKRDATVDISTIITIVVVVVCHNPAGRTIKNALSVRKARLRTGTVLDAKSCRVLRRHNEVKMTVKIKVVQYPIEEDRINRLVELTGAGSMRDAVDEAVKIALKEKRN